MKFVRSAIALLLAMSVASAQDKPAIVKALETFFELGLPDAKGGKWVRCNSMESREGGSLPGGYRAEYSGNAWLLRETKGMVEVVVTDGRFIRGKRVKDEDASGDEGPATAAVNIQPADLDGDLKKFLEALKSGDEQQGGDPDSQAEAKARVAGASLLFLAQLQRQGRGDFVREALPQVLALVSSPEMALDAAVSQLADGRLAELAREWTGKGDAGAYAAGITALAANFSRGWNNRDAALFLAAGLREQKPAPLSGEADARKVAELLLKLKPGEFAELPMGRNWFIEGAGGGRGNGRFPGGEDEDEDEEGEGKPAKRDGRVAVFFARKREAAIGLAKLLDDHRYLRSGSSSDSDHGYNYRSRGKQASREETLREDYNRIPRPREIGEIAWVILGPVLPDGLRSAAEERPATRVASVLEWLKTVAAKSDEEIAWDYLRSASGTYDDEFRSGLRFLVAKGGADTLAKLKEVFLDPAVWNSSSVDEMIPQTQQYLKRASADAAFPDKLRAAVKAGFAVEEAEQGRHSGDREEEMKKQMAARRAAHLKQVEQLFKPPQGVGDQLAEIAAMDETEAMAALQAAGQSLAKKPLVEFEAPIFQAAAKAKSPKIKGQLLQLAMAAAMRGGRGQREGGAKTPPAFPADAVTREAVAALLRDETSVPNEWDPLNAPKVGDFTSWALVGLHSDQSREGDWQQIHSTAPHLAKKLIRTHALAIAEGKPVPPMPDASKVSAGRAAAIVAELGALPAGGIPASLEGKTPDEQLAVITHLERTEEWPSSVMEAHFTIRKVGGNMVADLGGEGWKGRRLDEKMLHELEVATAKAAGEGKFATVTAGVPAPLAGVEISVLASRQKMPVSQLDALAIPGLSGKPAPAAVLFVGMQAVGMSQSPDGGASFGWPIWKDEAITRAWREEHGKASPAPEQKKPETRPGRRGPTFSANPAAFEQKLRDCLSRKKDARHPFRLMISTSAIGNDGE